METYSVKQIKGDVIDKIWLKFKHVPVIERGYMCIDSIKCNSMLFIGINPSFPDNRKENYGSSFYELTQNANHYKKYYGKLEELAKNSNIEWSHLDLLYYRETKQESFNDLINTPAGKEFVWEQLMVSKDIIESVNPKIIVVSNTLARRLMGFEKEKGNNEWMNYDFQFDDDIGTYRITTKGSLLNTPVFFTSMLSGQRALDLGSYKRLEWHIKYVCKKINLNQK